MGYFSFFVVQNDSLVDMGQNGGQQGQLFAVLAVEGDEFVGVLIYR